MKKLANLKGVRTLNRIEKKAINGGKIVCCYSYPQCPPSHEISCLVIGNNCYYFPGEGTEC